MLTCALRAHVKNSFIIIIKKFEYTFNRVRILTHIIIFLFILCLTCALAYKLLFFIKLIWCIILDGKERSEN